MGLATVERDFARPAGYAIIRVSDAAVCADDPRFRLRRGGTGLTFLGLEGWQAEDALLDPETVETEDGDLVLRLGPTVVNHLKEAPYTFALPKAGIEQDVTWLPIPPLLVPHQAAARENGPGTPEAVATKPDRETDDVDIYDSLVGKAEQQREDWSLAFNTVPLGSGWSTTNRRPTQARLIPIGAGLLVLGGAAILMLRWQLEPQEPHNPISLQAPVMTTPTTPHDASSAPDDLASLSIPEVVARGLPPTIIRTEGKRRLQAGRIGEGMQLLEQAANLGNTAAMTELAQAYDPATPAFGTLRKDTRQAAHYYRDAERGGDASVAPRRDALRLALEQRAASGETEARLVLRQYWP